MATFKAHVKYSMTRGGKNREAVWLVESKNKKSVPALIKDFCRRAAIDLKQIISIERGAL